MTSLQHALAAAAARAIDVRSAEIDIYERLIPERPDLFFTDRELEAILTDHLVGVELSGPIRTRSKLAKGMVAEALGYKAPPSFKKTKPRFLGQDLDIHVQKDDNLQIWNQEVSPERRYVLVRPAGNGIVQAVRVVRGQQIALWDTTGTLTSKYQAKRKTGATGSKLVSPNDTEALVQLFKPTDVAKEVLASVSSSEAPKPGRVLSIGALFARLLNLRGQTLPAVRAEQDRMRGELLQEAVSRELGLETHQNFAQWPDIVSQALEVKLQTSPTIDLGLVLPTDEGAAVALSPALRHCDARYVVAYGELNARGATQITEVVVTTGTDFFSEFKQFGGLVQNRKRQIRLPKGLFESQG